MSESVDQNLLECIEMRLDVFNMNMMPDLRWQNAYRVVVLDKRHCTVRTKDNTITSRRLFEEVEGRLS